MITVTVNNEIQHLPRATLLEEFLTTYCPAGSQYAVAINGEFVPRSTYSTRQLQADDCLDIVSPVGGG